MPGGKFDNTGKYIAATYQRVVQFDSSSEGLFDGYGDTISNFRLTGSLNVYGNFYADNLLVSSSTIYASGSTKFGDSLDDTHQITGSLLVTGSTRFIADSSVITGSLLVTGSSMIVGNETTIGATKITGSLNFTGSADFTGTIKFNYISYSAPIWNDIRVNLENTRINAATSKPDYDPFIMGTKAYAFDPGSDEFVTFAVQIPHSYKEGSDIETHVHWSPPNANAGNVIWGLRYTWANIGQQFPLTTTELLATASAPGVAYQHTYTDMGILSGSGKTVSSMLMCKLFRSGTATADNYGSDAFCIEFDLHYIMDSPGSKYETSK